MLHLLIQRNGNKLPSEIVERLRSIYNIMQGSVNSVRESGRRLVSLSQLIDFFVHDMLDFGVLSEKSENFTRTLEVFDLRMALNEIEEIFHEKLSTKKMTFNTSIRREN